MPPALRFGASTAIFVVTLALALTRPREVHEAYWTCLGATAMIALRLVTPVDVAQVLSAAKAPLLFLLALLVLSALLECSGFFEWAAAHAARRARGDGRALYRNVFLLGAAITAVLSLDTTAVILTPLVLAFVKRLRLSARPYIFACAFVANTASLLLPISNLTNLLFAGTFGLRAAPFAARMALPQVAALAVTYGLCRFLFRAQLPATFEAALLPAPSTVVVDRPYFRAAVAGLALVCVGYFVAPVFGLEPYVPAFGVSVVLAAYGLRRRCVPVRQLVASIHWAVFPFVVGLFVLVRGIENLGLARWAVGAMDGVADRHFVGLAVVVIATAGASNVVNNLPAALMSRGILLPLGAPGPLVYGALLGTNIGPNVVVFGSLATILVLAQARQQGERVTSLDFMRVGLVVTPFALAAATAALGLVFAAGAR